jgi:cytochrome c oxidase subunit 4
MRTASIRVGHRLAAFVALVLLATLSLVLGTSLHWYWGDVAISLVIAAVKTIIVLWFFMDMADQPFRARLAIGIAVILVALLVGLTVTDVATRWLMPRGPVPSPGEAFFVR